MSFLVVDIGTSSCRTSVVSRDGNLIAQSREPIEVDTAPPYFAEVDPDRLWTKVQKTIKAVLIDFNVMSLECVGVSSMLGYVFLGDDDRPLMPAIIYADNRAITETEEILNEFSGKEIYNITGKKISPELLAPKYRWLAKHKPELTKRIRRIIGLKDEIVRRLTGVVKTDVIHMNYTLLYNIHRKALDLDMLKSLGIDKEIFPEPSEVTDIVGTIDKHAAAVCGLKSGLPVICGSTDGYTAMFGGGVLEKERAVLVAGTTDVLMMSVSSPPQDEFCSLTINSGVESGSFLVGGAMGSSGGTMRKLEALLNKSAEELEEKIDQLKPGSEKLLSLPGLTGERAPFWDESLRGSMIGMSPDHGPEHLFRSTMEGTTYRLKKLLETLKRCKLVPDVINIVGGCANSTTWNQIRSDGTGRVFSKPDNSEATSRGTALFCKAGIDRCSVTKAAKGWNNKQKLYFPDIKGSYIYKKLWLLYDRYIEDIRVISKRLRDFNY